MTRPLRQKVVSAVVLASAVLFHSHVVVAQTTARTAPAAAPAAPKIAPVDASRSTLRVMATEAPNAAQWALAPLEQATPPDIRENLIALKEDIADEAKVRPIGTVAAYQAAYRLCRQLITTLDERNLSQVRAGYRTAQIDNVPLVTSQALEARRNYMMSWPQYAREQDQRAAIERQATTNGNVDKAGLKVQWAERAAALRPVFDQLYIGLRAELRATPALLVRSPGPDLTNIDSIPTPGATASLATNNPATAGLSSITSETPPGSLPTINKSSKASRALRGENDRRLVTPGKYLEGPFTQDLAEGLRRAAAEKKPVWIIAWDEEYHRTENEKDNIADYNFHYHYQLPETQKLVFDNFVVVWTTTSDKAIAEWLPAPTDDTRGYNRRTPLIIILNEEGKFILRKYHYANPDIALKLTKEILETVQSTAAQ